MRIDYYLQPEQVDERQLSICHRGINNGTGDPPAIDLPDWVPLAVKQALYAERAKTREEERRNAEQQRAIEFTGCESEALVLWSRLALSLANKQKVCSLEYFQDFVASLKSVVQDAQGLHK